MNIFETVKTISVCGKRHRLTVLRSTDTASHSAPFTMTDTPACMWQTIIIIALPAERMAM